MVGLKPTWAQVVNRAFWFCKFVNNTNWPQIDKSVDTFLDLKSVNAPKEFAVMMGLSWKGGYELPPSNQDSAATPEEIKWAEAFIKLFNYYERFQRMPSDSLTVDIFQGAFANLSAYTES